MATATISEPPNKTVVVIDVPLDTRPPASLPAPRPEKHGTERERTAPVGASFLSDVLLENHHLENSKKSKILDLGVVILLHVALIMNVTFTLQR